MECLVVIAAGIAHITLSDRKLLEILIRENDLDGFQKVIRNVVSIDAAVYFAVNLNRVEIMKVLLEMGASVTGTDRNSPAHEASRMGSLQCLKLLPQTKAVLCKVITGKQQPIHAASESGSENCIRYIVSICGIDVLYEKSKGLWTAAHFMAAHSHVNCLKLASELTEGKVFYEPDKLNRYPSHLISRNGTAEAFNAIPVDTFILPDNKGSTAVHCLAHYNNIIGFRWILDNLGSTVLSIKDSTGLTPCHYALKNPGKVLNFLHHEYSREMMSVKVVEKQEEFKPANITMKRWQRLILMKALRGIPVEGILLLDDFGTGESLSQENDGLHSCKSSVCEDLIENKLVKATSIVVCNPSLRVCREFNSRIPGVVLIQKVLSSSWSEIETFFSSKRLSCCWLDYCGPLDDESRSDVKKLFKCNLSSPSIVCFTFSWRGRSVDRTGGPKDGPSYLIQFAQNLNNELNSSANLEGFSLSPVVEPTQCGQLFYLSYVATKIEI